MFRRPTEFGPCITADARHLRATETRPNRFGKNALAHTSEIVDAIGPALTEIVDRLGKGQRLAVDEAANSGNEAVKRRGMIGTAPGGHAATSTRQRPFVATMVTLLGNRRSPKLGRRQDSLHSGNAWPLQ